MQTECAPAPRRNVQEVPMIPSRRSLPADQAGFAMAGLLMVVLLLAAVGMFSVAHTALDAPGRRP